MTTPRQEEVNRIYVEAKRVPRFFAALAAVFGMQCVAHADVGTPICDRTPQVRDAIVAAVQQLYPSVAGCKDLTEAHLTKVTTLGMQDKDISTLQSGDFKGLPKLLLINLNANDMTSVPEDVFKGIPKFETLSIAGNDLASIPDGVFTGVTRLKRITLTDNDLTSLHEDAFDGLSLLQVLALGFNDLSSLPEDLFDGLSLLQFLYLHANDLTALPEDLFDGLSSLEILHVSSNDLTSLPEDLFDGLTKLRKLDLHDLELTSVPADLFDGLTSLKQLRLSQNRLTSLPDGVFAGLTKLEELDLRWNPFPLNLAVSLEVSLEKVADGEFKAKVHTGAPFDIVLPVSAANGTIDGGATTITITTGRVESEPLAVTRTTGTTDAVTVSIGDPLPALPSRHSGYRLVAWSTAVPVLADLDNTPPTGAPAITGTAQVGETMTASTDGIADADGLDDAEFSYQWIGNDGSADADISDATGQKYTPGTDDVGKALKVRVTFTDAGGTEETLTSAATAAVAARSALSVADAEATEEDDTALAFAVTMAPAAARTVTVNYATSDGTATAGADYTATSGTLTFAVGETSKTVSVPITDDTVDEGGETLTLTLSNPTVAEILDATATGTISDAEGLTASFTGVPEAHDGQTAFSFRVEFSEEIGIGYAVFRDHSFDVANGDVTNAHRVDGSRDLWNVTVQPASNAAVTVVLRGNRACGTTGAVCTYGADPQPLTNSPSATVDGPDNAAPTGAPTIAGAAQVGETLTASTSGIDDADGLDDAEFSYQWIRNDGSDADIANATNQTYTPVTDDVGSTLKVRVTFTDDGGTAETLTSAATAGVAARSALSVADAQATEEDDTALEFEVTLSPAAARTVTVAYATSDGTATAGEDYTATSGILTFAVGDTSKTVSVPITDDSFDDGGETLTLTLSNAAVAEIADASATGTINNEEPLTASFSEVPESHAGAEFTFVLTFSEEPKVSFLTLRDDAFDVTSGTVEKARRRTAGSNLSWDITVAPAGTGAVEVELPATPNCTATAAICTADGRGLSNSPSATVAGAPAANAVVNGPLLTLSWPTPPDGFAPPDGSDFAVMVDGGLRPVASAAFQMEGVALVLAEPVLPDQTVAVDHLGSAMHPLRSAAGTLRPAWRDLPALNVTGWSAESLAGAGVTASAPNLAPTVWNAAQSASFAGRELTDPGLSALAGMTDLRRLDLSDNALTDVSALAGLSMLESLDLSGNAVSDLAPLAALTELRRLDLAGNRIEELWPLGALPKLEVLVLAGNRVTDLGALTHHGRLEHLGLAGNRVADTGPLADLWSLRRLDLGGNPVRDLSPLGDLATLVWLRLPSAGDEAPTHRMARLGWLLAPDSPGACLGCARGKTVRAPAR